ncbi:hypothetical protein HH212_26900 (plasmid) [Massilia forsythiae]|uniref:YgiT-type zinc finger protein n=1 Tax=Massilia forsythiae TaxID=2728020 RepID=A0A7Z2ZVH9_9BURK|nr:type II TA system antitoxin MqsA family protein [Massilia forsythiae]QJE03731.1 hypothetical protein HH212_26900 [Massilia forsythiae]
MNSKETQVFSSITCCPMCEKEDVITERQLEKFEYGSGEKPALLSIYIPVNVCKSCGYEFVDEKADEIRHDAICNHLNLLTSSKIQEIRMRLGGSQKSFAEFSHLGVASVQRWEKRQVLQSESNDIYLRLLEFPENVKRLERWNAGLAMEENTSKSHEFQGKGLDANGVSAHIRASQTFSLKRKVG